MPQVVLSPEASEHLEQLKATPAQATRLKKTYKALAWLQSNPRHPGLNSHKYQSVKGPGGVDLWESYIENHTPGAWRVFWVYGPQAETITIVSIAPHP